MSVAKRKRRPAVQELHGHVEGWDGPEYAFLLPVGAAAWRLRFDAWAGALAGSTVVPEREPVEGSAFPAQAGRQFSVEGFLTSTRRLSAHTAPQSQAEAEADVQLRPCDPRKHPDSLGTGHCRLRLLPAFPSDANDANDERTLIVLHLNRAITEAYLVAQFGRYGPVEQALVHCDERGTPMGFASIRMKSKDACRQALREMHNKILMGSRIQVFVDPGGDTAAARRRALIDRRNRWEQEQRAQLEKHRRPVEAQALDAAAGARGVPHASQRPADRLSLTSDQQGASPAANGARADTLGVQGPDDRLILASDQQRTSPVMTASSTQHAAVTRYASRDERDPRQQATCAGRHGIVRSVQASLVNDASRRAFADAPELDRERPNHADRSVSGLDAYRSATARGTIAGNASRTESGVSMARTGAPTAGGSFSEDARVIQVAGVPVKTPRSVLMSAFRRFGKILRIKGCAEPGKRDASESAVTSTEAESQTRTFLMYFRTREQALEAAAHMDQHMIMGKRVRVSCVVDQAVASGSRPEIGNVRDDAVEGAGHAQGLLSRASMGANGRLVHSEASGHPSWKRLSERGRSCTNAPSGVTEDAAVRGRVAGDRTLYNAAKPVCPTNFLVSTEIHAVRLSTLPFNTPHYELNEALASAPCSVRTVARAPFWYVLFADAADLYRFTRWLRSRNQELLGCSILFEACRVTLAEDGSGIHEVTLMRAERSFATRLELLDAIGDIFEGQVRHALLRDLHREILDKVAQQVMETFEARMREKLARQRLESGGDKAAKPPRMGSVSLDVLPELAMRQRSRRSPGSEPGAPPDPQSAVEKGASASSAVAELARLSSRSSLDRAAHDSLSVSLLEDVAPDEDQVYLQRVLECCFQPTDDVPPQLSASIVSTLDQDKSDIATRYREHWSPYLETLFDTHGICIKQKLQEPEPPANSTGCARTEGYAAFSRELKAFRWRPPKQVIIPADEARRWSATGSLRGTRVEQRQLLSAVSDREQTVLYLQQRERFLRFYRSGIHGYGLWALEDIPAGDYIIEYRGELVRSAVADLRERAYRQQGMGDSFMFRIDADTVVDATHIGSVARFVNHSCDPNAIARIVQLGGASHILFYSKRSICVGEEITYDYNFDIEDDASEKVPCLCGAPNCRQYLN